MPPHRLRPVLEGRYVRLRPLRPSDTADLQRHANDPTIARFTTVPYPYTLAHARDFIQQSAPPNALPLCIALRATDEFIGMCSLMDIDPPQGTAELGYWISRLHRRKGYTTEAVRLIIRHGFQMLGLTRIYAGTHPANQASAQLLRRIGFTYEGTTPHFRPNLAGQTIEKYTLRKEDWAATQAD